MVVDKQNETMLIKIRLREKYWGASSFNFPFLRLLLIEYWLRQPQKLLAGSTD